MNERRRAPPRVVREYRSLRRSRRVCKRLSPTRVVTLKRIVRASNTPRSELRSRRREGEVRFSLARFSRASTRASAVLRGRRRRALGSEASRLVEGEVCFFLSFASAFARRRSIRLPARVERSYASALRLGVPSSPSLRPRVPGAGFERRAVAARWARPRRARDIRSRSRLRVALGSPSGRLRLRGPVRGRLRRRLGRRLRGRLRGRLGVLRRVRRVGRPLRPLRLGRVRRLGLLGTRFVRGVVLLRLLCLRLRRLDASQLPHPGRCLLYTSPSPRDRG